MTPSQYLRSLSSLRLALHLRRAAQQGLTADEWAAEILRQQSDLDAIRVLTYDRAVQWRVIARHAAARGRRFA
jgi:hypothetical protein